MSLFKESFQFAAVKTAAFFFMLFPLSVSRSIARFVGQLGYCFLFKKRAVIYANLKTSFGHECSPSQLRVLTKQALINFIESFVELLCLPKMKRLGFENFVEILGRENLEEAVKKGQGVILLAIHSGSWELASVVGGVAHRPYHVVANQQSKAPQLDALLNEYRQIAGAHVIKVGSTTKDIIKALKANEIVSLVLDQGGKEGVAVPFLGKTASMSTGAIRLALKYGSAVCPVWIERRPGGKHVLTFSPALPLKQTGDMDQDVRYNVALGASFFEKQLIDYPFEYMWFYKIFKYSTEARIVIVDDGRTGHLRQSQAISRMLTRSLRDCGKMVSESTVQFAFNSNFKAKSFSLYSALAQFVRFLRYEDCLKYFLTPESYKAFMAFKADYVISCGSQGAGINYILSSNHQARSISILTPGLLNPNSLNLNIVPEHDQARFCSKKFVLTTKVAPNLVNTAYLKSQAEGLLKYYSHLNGNVRMKFGILLGGDAKGVIFDENKIRLLLSQVKEAALHYNADILITTSRRTSPAIEQLVIKELKNFERCPLCIIANTRNIPEAVGGILGLSDLVIVSGESVSMVSEALSSAKKTIVFSPLGQYEEKPRDKYERFVLKLNDDGYLMASSCKDISAKIAQLLSHKIILKKLDDQGRLHNAIEKIIS